MHAAASAESACGARGLICTRYTSRPTARTGAIMRGLRTLEEAGVVGRSGPQSNGSRNPVAADEDCAGQQGMRATSSTTGLVARRRNGTCCVAHSRTPGHRLWPVARGFLSGHTDSTKPAQRFRPRNQSLFMLGNLDRDANLIECCGRWRTRMRQRRRRFALAWGSAT